MVLGKSNAKVSEKYCRAPVAGLAESYHYFFKTSFYVMFVMLA